MSQIPVRLAGRVRYSKVKRRSVDDSTVNAYIILSKYKEISISREQIILREPEKSPCFEPRYSSSPVVSAWTLHDLFFVTSN
jgi:hypothetical protein